MTISVLKIYMNELWITYSLCMVLSLNTMLTVNKVGEVPHTLHKNKLKMA